MTDITFKTSRDEFYELIADSDQNYDLIVVERISSIDVDEVFDNICEEIEQENDFSVYYPDLSVIQSIEQIYQSIYHFVFNEPLKRDMDMAELLEVLEEEVAETKPCIVVIRDFDLLTASLKKAFLELIIVTENFKILLCVDHGFSLKIQGERLWDVLKHRCVEIRATDLDDENSVENSAAVVDGIEVDADEIGEEKEIYRIKTDDDDDIIDQDEDEDDFENDDYDASENDSRSQNNELVEKLKNFYKLLPVYHILAVLVLALVLWGLWKIDFSAGKSEVIDIDLSRNIFLEEKLDTEGSGAYRRIQSSDVALDAKEPVVDAQPTALEEKAEAAASFQRAEIPAPETEAPSVSQATKIQQAPVATNVAKKPALAPTPAQTQTVGQKVNWSPYQSDQWIKSLNRNYFSLQLMASHEEQGIRDFLTRHGVSSQYAVYTTKKDGRDWHVVIYGVYQTREFADEARKQLPGYLREMNPWIRSLADVQNSI